MDLIIIIKSITTNSIAILNNAFSLGEEYLYI